MADAQVIALKRRFGLSAVPPIVFTPTPSGKVWGGLGDAGDGLSPRDAQLAFIDWLAASYPGLVEAMLEAIAPEAVIETGTLGAAEESNWLTQLVGAAQTILPAYLQYEQQAEVLDLQLERMRAGLPPLDSAQFAPSVQVGLDSETIRRMADEAAARAASGAGAALSSPWLWIAIGGGALAFIAMQSNRRRRRR